MQVTGIEADAKAGTVPDSIDKRDQFFSSDRTCGCDQILQTDGKAAPLGVRGQLRQRADPPVKTFFSTEFAAACGVQYGGTHSESREQIDPWLEDFRRVVLADVHLKEQMSLGERHAKILRKSFKPASFHLRIAAV